MRREAIVRAAGAAAMVVCAWGVGPSVGEGAMIRRDDMTLGEFQKEAECSGPIAGKTTLLDIAAMTTPARNIAGLKATLEGQYSGATIPGTTPPVPRAPADRWVFNPNGAALRGTLVIERYVAGDTDENGKCIHGANFSARYIPHPDDPRVDFVQMVTTSEPFNGLPAGTPVIDPYPDRGADDAPYYYGAGAPRVRIAPAPPPAENAVVFEDLPEIKFTESDATHDPHSGSQTFWLVLASNDGKTMTLHEGIMWGWTGGCVPEPAHAGWLFGGLGALHRRPGRGGGRARKGCIAGTGG